MVEKSLAWDESDEEDGVGDTYRRQVLIGTRHAQSLQFLSSSYDALIALTCDW